MTAARPVLPRQQAAVLDAIRQHADRLGYPPTIREIGTAVGLSSTSTVHRHLLALVAKGYIRRYPDRPRAIEVLP